MKKSLFQIIFAAYCLSAAAQKVSNIRAEQHGQDIVVLYSLETSSPCEVSLLLSQNNGANWSAPLKNVSGDVGKKVSGGEKQITWKVLEEQEFLVGDKMKFKVIAIGKLSFEPEMVFVEGGTFQMGSNKGLSNASPVHSVNLSSFNIGKYEVTQAQWIAIMGYNPSSHSDCDNCPVDGVSWNEVQEYLKKLNFQTGKSYRLPTEAEWEYSALGGKFSKGYLFSGSNNGDSAGWFKSNSFNITHEVGRLISNELGIYDMSGNVCEWCGDWYVSSYPRSSQNNPTGPIKGQKLAAYIDPMRVMRGFSIGHEYSGCGVRARSAFDPEISSAHIGFRLVLSNPHNQLD